MENLLIYTGILENSCLKHFRECLEAEDHHIKKKKLFDGIRVLVEEKKSFEDLFFQTMMEEKSSLLQSLSFDSADSIGVNCLLFDLKILKKFLDDIYNLMDTYNEDGKEIIRELFRKVPGHEGLKAYQEFFVHMYPDDLDTGDALNFISLLKAYGTGIYALHEAFYLNDDQNLMPIANYCPLEWDYIYEYESQKAALLENTWDFIEGKPFNHGLLVGASGTGKSSSVKAVVQLLAQKKLRLIQLYKGQLKHLPELLDKLSRANFKFILFLDDLSFEANEDEYKLLKTYIEGGVVDVAGNIVFYVTTNRRHLIKEVRTERESDIHLQDFIQEMTSLSKRFGLTLTFEPLVQDEYFSMIRKMMDRLGLDYDEEELEIEARRFSLRKAGMSGRVANQFVKSKMKAWS